MAIKQDELDAVVNVLRELATDLEDSGTDEWESLEDCICATEGNFFNDCQLINSGK